MKVPKVGKLFKPPQIAIKALNTKLQAANLEPRLCKFDRDSEKAEAAVAKANAVSAKMIAVIEAIKGTVGAVWLDLLKWKACAVEALRLTPGHAATEQLKTEIEGFIGQVVSP